MRSLDSDIQAFLPIVASGHHGSDSAPCPMPPNVVVSGARFLRVRST